MFETRSGHILSFLLPLIQEDFSAVVSYWRKYVHEVLVNYLGGLSLPRESVVRLTDRSDMTIVGLPWTLRWNRTKSNYQISSLTIFYQNFRELCKSLNDFFSGMKQIFPISMTS